MTTWTLHPDFNDLLVVDDEAMVLTRDQVLRIGPIASVLVEACQHAPASSDTLVTLCCEVFGAPPEGSADEAVAANLEELARLHVLTEVLL